MTSHLPLLVHTSAGAIVAYRQGIPVTARQFLADVARAAQCLPPGSHVFNVCTDRYLFAVGICATLVAGKISLLPPSQTPDMVRQLAAFAPDVYCLHDGAHCDIALPRVRMPDMPATPSEPGDAGEPLSVPAIPADRTLAYLFTSGSTGQPVPHRKRWGDMVCNARAAALRLALPELGPGAVVVGTVPPQHMYGLECTVMLPLQAGIALSDARPFYPADIAGALDAVPAPRVLVASPVHLRALQQSTVTLPPVALILSATAPLAPKLAREAEARQHAPLTEIYGSTETGHIAMRRPTQSAAWQLLAGITLRPGPLDQDGEATVLAQGAHLAQAVALNDAIELLDDGRFLLHGRKADLINIAGKRTSLAYLNQHLAAIAGVADGVFVMPHDDERGGLAPVARLMAVVVAPGLTAADIQRGLRERIDPAFLPRRILFAPALPRNTTGKLPREALEALVATLLSGPALTGADRDRDRDLDLV
jgi:acyl-coenzyme A synthetase/AMP-(fatty) acid ligase